MQLLGLGGDDWLIAAAVLQKAATLHHEQRAAELKAHAEAVGAYVAERIARIF